MLSDDRGLMFPKPGKKKKRQRHKKSILNTEKGQCFLCARRGDRSYKRTEEHHIVFGNGGRKISEGEGFKVYLCESHHRTGKDAAHNSRKTRESLCRLIQEEYEKTHTRDEWMKKAGKNYR